MRHMSRADYERVFQQVLGTPLPGVAPGVVDVWGESVAQEWQLGSRRVVNNGGMTRVYYYAHISALITAGLARGRVMMSTDVGTERGAFLGAMTAGQRTVTWTAVAAITLNQFRFGWLLLQGGRALEVAGNTAAGAGAVSTLTLFDPLPETLAAGRTGLLQENPYANVANRGGVGSPVESANGCVMGVINGDYTAGNHVWLQTAGPCGVVATPATLGDADNEHYISIGVNPGDEVGIATGWGMQPIGKLMIAAAQCWEGENFIIVDLNIKN